MGYHPTDPDRWPSQTPEGWRNRNRQIAYGRWRPYVDAEPARQHVLALRAAGMGPVTIARVSGVPHGSLAKLIYGDPRRNLAPSKRIRPGTEKKLLAVQPTLDLLAGGAKVPALGTQRRIQALHAIGWSLSEIARRIGVTRSQMDRVLKRSHVFARTARATVVLFRELCMTPGPSTRARLAAKRKGWPPPLAWDDIDDPDETPGGESEADGNWKLAEFEHLRSLGVSEFHALRQIGISKSGLENIIKRRRLDGAA